MPLARRLGGGRFPRLLTVCHLPRRWRAASITPPIRTALPWTPGTSTSQVAPPIGCRRKKAQMLRCVTPQLDHPDTCVSLDVPANGLQLPSDSVAGTHVDPLWRLMYGPSCFPLPRGLGAGRRHAPAGACSTACFCPGWRGSTACFCPGWRGSTVSFIVGARAT